MDKVQKYNSFNNMLLVSLHLTISRGLHVRIMRGGKLKSTKVYPKVSGLSR
jgi:hypothetical protein